MGISANQARLLALTARKCDLETQMQLILNNKVNMARATSDIANAYDDAISNRKLSIFRPTTNAPIVDPSASAESIYQSLSAKNLFNATGGGMLLVKKNSGGTYEQVTQNLDTPTIEKGLREGTLFLVTEATAQTQDPKTITFSGDATSGYMGGKNASGVDATLLAGKTKWEMVDWRSSTTVLDQLDKSDDEAAQASYERSMKEIEYKEAQMDLEMNQIETSHSAITNEIESVKKIMTKNTEDSFKYFS